MPRPRTPWSPITTRTVKDAKPRTTRYLIFDGLLHGFALKVETSGAKVWVVQKSQAGRTVRVTLGSFPDLTVDQARRDAQGIVTRLVHGGDPTAEKRAMFEARRRSQREASTVAALWARYRLEVVAPRNKPSTAAAKDRMWKSRIGPAVGHWAVRDITGNELSAIVRAPLRLDGKGNVVGGKGEAGNLFRLLHHLFAKALTWRLRPLELGHPLDGIEQPRVPRRERLLSDHELSALLGALDRSAGREALQVLTAIRLCLLTGWRVGELLTLRWADLRRDLGEAHLPDTKTGYSARPVADEVFNLLDGVERRPGVPWVLPGITDPRVSLDYGTLAKAFRRVAQRAGLSGVTAHTLRHRVVTSVAGVSPNIRTGMAVTGHKSAQAFMHYVHAERHRSKAVAAEVSGKMVALAALPSPEKIVELTPKPRVRRA